ncbi:hypothetical protein MMC13_004044 [Lambiella insularis]|nr:hypothetical protein [Lambiella insularis]
MAGSIRPSERDALWAAAGLLGAVAFCYVEADTPEEAWPLNIPSPLDLNWLKMSFGRKEIWQLTQTLMAGSMFQALALESSYPSPSSSNRQGLEALPLEFLELYDLEATSNINNNPYHAPVCAVAELLDVDGIIPMIKAFLSFLGGICPDFKQLLELKEPRALLLLAYSYAKVCQYGHTWLYQRATLEGQAICLYLERYHQNERSIQNLLRFPKMMCGVFDITAYPTSALTPDQCQPNSTRVEVPSVMVIR